MSSAPRVLIIDDDLDIRLVIRTLLESRGVIVDTASDGEQALAKIQGFRPDLVLLDLMMPNMNGTEFVSEFRRRHRDEPEIVVISGDIAIEQKASHIGARAWLRKPFELEELIAMVEIHAERFAPCQRN